MKKKSIITTAFHAENVVNNIKLFIRSKYQKITYLIFNTLDHLNAEPPENSKNYSLNIFGPHTKSSSIMTNKSIIYGK